MKIVLSVETKTEIVCWIVEIQTVTTSSDQPTTISVASVNTIKKQTVMMAMTTTETAKQIVTIATVVVFPYVLSQQKFVTTVLTMTVTAAQTVLTAIVNEKQDHQA